MQAFNGWWVASSLEGHVVGSCFQVGESSGSDLQVLPQSFEVTGPLAQRLLGCARLKAFGHSSARAHLGSSSMLM